MKKIGILFGQENTFPQAFVEEINSRGEKEIVAEFVKIDKLSQASDSGYAVIFDRISQDVPFYKAFLKNAALMGATIINNPFWWSADEKFFNNCLAVKLGVPVPKTYLLPSHSRPDDTSENSFRNLEMPMDWDTMFAEIGFPAYMKPHSGGGWKSVYKVKSIEDFYEKHAETGQLVMLLQEEIIFDEYFRCYCIGGKYVKIMQYEPRNEPHLRYVVETPVSSQALLNTVEEYSLKLCIALGYDFNTVEFAVRDGIPYAIDFCNPAPDADVNSVGQENFDWVVKTAADFAIEKAKSHKAGGQNQTWGTFIRESASGNVALAKKEIAVNQAAPKAAKKAVAKKAVAKKAPQKGAGK
jgi:hypothetical protein